VHPTSADVRLFSGQVTKSGAQGDARTHPGGVKGVCCHGHPMRHHLILTTPILLRGAPILSRGRQGGFVDSNPRFSPDAQHGTDADSGPDDLAHRYGPSCE